MPSGENDLTAQFFQLLYFVPEIRGSVQLHLSSSPRCLASEARLLFDALTMAVTSLPPEDMALPPDNVARAVAQLKGVGNLGFLHPTHAPPAKRMHTFA